ncbi:unnamed protein product [Dibothriocephalus latus]|uniref:Uncharacterized protein n=1 Tax=Dibothriocephalus latus TaxID=60516 RepID=A0A3P7L029_DIBLA|nr:unnamed protein product [Dibothriocephalus latus]
MNSSGRENKLYRCPPTPPLEQQRSLEHAFILDGVAAASISRECAQYTTNFVSIYPPYNAANVPTKVVAGVGEAATIPRNAIDYLQKRNANGYGHSEDLVLGHPVKSTPLFHGDSDLVSQARCFIREHHIH